MVKARSVMMMMMMMTGVMVMTMTLSYDDVHDGYVNTFFTTHVYYRWLTKEMPRRKEKGRGKRLWL